MRDYSKMLSDDSVTVFLLHGVIPRQRWKVRNATRKHILTAEFKAFCKNLKKSGQAVSMDDVLSIVQGECKMPQKAFCLTFDDGFENNYTIASDILTSLSIPCTFYVTTGFVGTDNVSWTDRIERMLEAAKGPASYKINLMRDMRTLLKDSEDVDPVDFSKRFEKSLGFRVRHERDLDGKLTWAQIRELAQDDLFTIGGHGHTHRILSYLTPSEIKEEIETSKNSIYSSIGVPIRHYSYPEGMEHCYSQAVIDALKANNIESAVLAYPGPNKEGTDPFRIHRVMVE